MTSRITKQTKILIVDDHPLLRQGIAQLINQQKDMHVCGQAEESRQVVDMVKKTSPDIIVLDVSLKGANGIELLKDIKTYFPKIKVLVLSMHDETVYGPRAIRAGAAGYVMKHEAIDRVITALRKILQGELYLSDAMSARMLHRMIGHSSPTANPIDELSDRELEVFNLLGKGLSTRAIAEQLHLSVKTIESHRAHIKEKLSLENATELMHHAIQWVQSENLGTRAQTVTA